LAQIWEEWGKERMRGGEEIRGLFGEDFGNIAVSRIILVIKVIVLMVASWSYLSKTHILSSYSPCQSLCFFSQNCAVRAEPFRILNLDIFGRYRRIMAILMPRVITFITKYHEIDQRAV
jgi:hypothetical protein